MDSAEKKQLTGLSVDELVAEANKIMAEQEKEKVELGNFDPFATTEAAKAIQKIYDEKLGWIQFGELNYKDMKELEKIDNSSDAGKAERTVQYVYIALKKAYPTLTLDQVKEWPEYKTARIAIVLGQRTKRFLLKKTSPITP